MTKSKIITIDAVIKEVEKRQQRLKKPKKTRRITARDLDEGNLKLKKGVKEKWTK